MAKFTLDDVDADISSMMGDIRRDFGDAAAEGRPSKQFQLDDEPPKFKLDEGTPGPSTEESQLRTRYSESPKSYWDKVKADYQKNRPDWGEVAPTPGGKSIAGAALQEVLAPLSTAVHMGYGAFAGEPKTGQDVVEAISPSIPEAREFGKARDVGNLTREAASFLLENLPLMGIGSGFGSSRVTGLPKTTTTSSSVMMTDGPLTPKASTRPTMIEGTPLPGGPPILEGPEAPLWSPKIPGANPIPVPDPLSPGFGHGKLSEQYSPIAEERLRTSQDIAMGRPSNLLPGTPDLANRPFASERLPLEPGEDKLLRAHEMPASPSNRIPGEGDKRMGVVELPKYETKDPLVIEPRERRKVAKGWEDNTRLPKVVTAETRLTPAQEAQFELDWEAARKDRHTKLIEPELNKSTMQIAPNYDTKPSLNKTSPPSAASRMVGTIHSELESTGPIGQEISWIDRVFITSTAEQLAYKDITALDSMFEKHFGKAPIWKRINPMALPDHTTFYNIKPEQVRELVNYLYTASGDYGKVLMPKDAKVKAFADELIDFNNKNSSSHPGVRQATVLGADGSKTPVGSPKAYYPHNPVAPELQDGLSGRAFDMAYKQRLKKEPNLTKVEFARRVQEYKDKYPRYAGLEMERVLDATDGGTKEPYAVLKDLGYGVDPLKDFSMRYVGMYKRGQQILAEPKMKELLDKLGTQYAGDPGSMKWVKTVSERIMGLDREFPDRMFNDFVTKSNNITNAALLQRSAVQQYNQMTFIMSRYGAGNLAKAIWNEKLPEGVRQQIIEKSAANFATYMQMLTPNPDFFGQVLQRELQVNLMTRSDSALRLLAARASDIDLMQYMSRYGGNVEHPAFVARLKEARFNPEQIRAIQKNGLTIQDRVQAAKIAADETQGRPGMQGIPSWAASAHGPLGRAMLNLKRFQLSNMTEIRRQTTEAWDKGVPMHTIVGRLTRMGLGAEVLGEITNDMAYTLLNWSSPFEDERTPQWMRKMMGPTVGRAVGNLASGLGSYQAALTMAVIQGTDDALGNLFVPVSGAKAWDVYQEVRKAIEKGDTDALARFVLKHTIGTSAPMGPKPDQSSGMPGVPNVMRGN